MRTRKDFVEFYSKYNKIDLEEAEKRIDFFIEAMKKALSENEEVIFRKFGSFEEELCLGKQSKKQKWRKL